MPRGVDHLVLCTPDLKPARGVYERIGLTATPDAHHPFGTGNFIVQLDGCFLEILAATRPELIPDDEDGAFNFGGFNRDFIARGPGMSMLVLDSTDEDADRADFNGKGLDVFAPFTFQRQAALPDGSEATVGFSLTFVGDSSLPGLGFFTCKQWRPDLFWKPDYQRHAIGATGIAEVLVVAPEPKSAAAFLATFADAGTPTPVGDGYAVETTRGRLSVLTPHTFAERFPNAGVAGRDDKPFFAGYILKAAPDAARTHWQANGLTVFGDDSAPWLGADTGLGYIVGVSRA